MGLIINQILETVNFSELMKALKIQADCSESSRKVHFGGPVQAEQGFVLHSADYSGEETVKIENNICLTATIDILRLVANGSGPRNSLFALGYAGWGPGQLDWEIQENGWMFGPAEEKLLFGDNDTNKWALAASGAGIDVGVVASQGGSA